jgi:hypothetical protein
VSRLLVRNASREENFLMNFMLQKILRNLGGVYIVGTLLVLGLVCSQCTIVYGLNLVTIRKSLQVEVVGNYLGKKIVINFGVFVVGQVLDFASSLYFNV